MTLLELIVVISLLAVLLLLVSNVIFKSFSEKKNEITNITNLRQITLACLTYAVDNNGRLPETKQYLDDNKQGLFLTMGINVYIPGSVRRLFQQGKWRFGTGARDYLDSADAFYGPFSPLLNQNREPGQMYQQTATSYRIGYSHFYLPDVDDSAPVRRTVVAPDGLLLSNHMIETAHPRAPLFSDAHNPATAELTGFPQHTRKVLFVAHMDASVDSVDLEKVYQRRASTRDMLLTLSGLIK